MNKCNKHTKHNGGFRFNEKYLSQIPAIQLLINLGYTYLPPGKILQERRNRLSNILLEDILCNQLKEINRIYYKGGEYLFSEENIQSAVQKLKNVKYDGLLKTNEKLFDLLTLGTSLEQVIEGNVKSFNLNYIDWRRPERNIFHVTTEFSVERSRSSETIRPDIVLFINGIPLGVIECKSPKVDVMQAVSQCIRNQTDEYIPRFFIFSQLLLGTNKNAALYATAGSNAKFWFIWKELHDKKSVIAKKVNSPLSVNDKNLLFREDFALARSYFDALEAEGNRLITAQDKAIYSLCRPERFLELIFKFIVFDAGIKKIARYQQYFVVKSTLNRIRHVDHHGRRKGGIIWHTQGSGKSLTMVMLARNLALDPLVPNPRIVLVTDRDDLDKQLGNTFAACGLDPKRATSGRNLLELVAERKASIITTLIHKFDKALNIRKYKDSSKEIFMLVDESHRTNFGTFAARMRQMFPNACYLGFTGTPLLKKEKNNFVKFGSLIDPPYPVTQAVEDGAVVPLLYEGRHVEMKQNKKAIDLWFERHTQGLSKEQKADLKRKYARAEMLNKADQVIYMRAFDISEHYRKNWQGTGFKGQCVAPSKAAALKYKEYLDETGYVTSEIVMSPPDAREGYEEVDDEPADAVVRFWKKMMKRYGNEAEYVKQIINQFKNGENPEILIVIDKLLTGFDAPRNTVLYLCRILREHTLLQAIARVNRIHEKKEFGYIIDYASILGELDTALTMYSALEGFDESDLDGTLKSVNEEIEKLPQRYSELWDIFKEVKNSYDEDAYEVLLSDDALRAEFYEQLTEYAKTLAIAFSSESFIENVPEEKLNEYKATLKRFQSLKTSVRIRYAEAIVYKDYEPKIKKLLDTHIQANEVLQLNKPVNIFDNKMFMEVKDNQGVYGSKSRGAKADAIAHATKRVITEKMEEDPAFYQKFSKLIQKAIDDFKAKRLSDLEYLNIVYDIRDKVVNKEHDNVPDNLKENEDAMAYYGVLLPFFEQINLKKNNCEKIVTHMALAVQSILTRHRKVHFWDDKDAKNKVINEIDDYLYDEIKQKKGIELSIEQMDEIIRTTMKVARHRSRN